MSNNDAITKSIANDSGRSNLLGFFKLLWKIKKRLDQERKNN